MKNDKSSQKSPKSKGDKKTDTRRESDTRRDTSETNLCNNKA
jgi:hypothetical protein